MNMSPTDQAVIVRVPTKHSELFTKDVSYSPTSIEAGDILVNAGYDAKTRSLEARRMQLQPTQFAASAPQLTPPKTLPEGQDALKLLNDLEKFDDMGVQVDEERLLKYVDDAIHYTYTAPLAAVVNTYTPSVDARIKGLLLRMIDNGVKSQDNRSARRQQALDLYMVAIKAKVDAIHQQGLNGLTGSLGAALGSAFIAGGGLIIQGRASTIKTNVVNDKENLNTLRQALKDEQKAQRGFEHQLRDIPREQKMAYKSDLGNVGSEISDVDRQLRSVNYDIQRIGSQDTKNELPFLNFRRDQLIQQKNQVVLRQHSINSKHSDVATTTIAERRAAEQADALQVKVDKMEIKIEGESIVAERQHTIGWTIVNLQTMSQALQSGFGVEVKNAEGMTVEQDGAINALQGQIQIHEQGLSHDLNVTDGLKSALAEVGRSHNDTLRGLRSV